MKYFLSKIIPVPMSTEFTDGAGQRQSCRWWQWRDRVWAVRD